MLNIFTFNLFYLSWCYISSLTFILLACQFFSYDPMMFKFIFNLINDIMSFACNGAVDLQFFFHNSSFYFSTTNSLILVYVLTLICFILYLSAFYIYVYIANCEFKWGLFDRLSPWRMCVINYIWYFIIKCRHKDACPYIFSLVLVACHMISPGKCLTCPPFSRRSRLRIQFPISYWNFFCYVLVFCDRT